MPVLYLTEQGSSLHKDGEVFSIKKDNTILGKIHAIEVEQIIIFGNVSLTTPVIDYILQQGIDCVFCNSYGKFHGRLISNESKFGLLRLKQMQTVLDQEKRLQISRAIVQGKLHNQRTLILRYQRKQADSVLRDTLKTLENSIEKVGKCENIAGLLGEEGAASAAYYRSFKTILNQELGFTARIRRPPTDPVNSLLSFGYTLLVYSIQAAIGIVGLDPYLGFLHATQQSRPNLALDLMEEFRPIIVDSMVLWLINTHVLTLADFELPEKEGQMVAITREGIKKLIHYYELKVQSKIQHPAVGGETSYRRCFELQARELAGVIQQQCGCYQPFRVR